MKSPTVKISSLGLKLSFIAGLCLAIIIQAYPAYAAPIPEQTVYAQQGKQNIYIKGNEFYQQFYILGDNDQQYTVVQGKDGKWYYAINDEKIGALIPGKSRVGKYVLAPLASKDLSPKGQALAEIRARQEKFKKAMARNNKSHLDNLTADRAEDRTTTYQTHIVFIEFPDVSPIYEADDFLKMIFSNRNNNPYVQTPNGYQAYGSARDYWEEVSLGELDIQPIIHYPEEGEWFMMPETRQYYDDNFISVTDEFHNEVIDVTGIEIGPDDFLIVIAAGRADHNSIF